MVQSQIQSNAVTCGKLHHQNWKCDWCTEMCAHACECLCNNQHNKTNSLIKYRKQLKMN